MAGVQALINQKAGSRQGNPNPEYYHLAATEYASNGTSCFSGNGAGVSSACIFYDVTQGDVDVNCAGKFNCYQPSGTSGVLSTSDSAYSPAYGTTTGWDFATGIGSINAANLVNNWPNSTPAFLLSASPSSLSLTQGTNVTTAISVIQQNGFSGSVSLSASGLPSGVTASFSPNPATTSSTLTLTATSTAATGTLALTVTGTSGSLASSTTATLTVTAAGNFTLSSSPSSLTIEQRAGGASTITVTPQNGFTGSVSLSASGQPSGVTASFSTNPATASSTLTLTASSTATTGTFSVAVAGTSGNLTHSTTLSLTVTAANNFTSGWLDSDVGSTGVAGSATFANGTFTGNGAGRQVWDTADSFNFAYQPLSGDGSIVARVVSISPTSATPGVMIRDSLNPNAMSAFGAYFNSNAYLNYRSSTGGSTSQASAPAGSLPYWLKLSRSGSTVSAYTSADGVNWTPIGSPQTINMGQNIDIGLALCSNNTSTLATATFDNVSVTSP